jgi:hypothetical protein
MRVIFTDIDGVLNPLEKEMGKTAIILYNKICKEFDLSCDNICAGIIL